MGIRVIVCALIAGACVANIPGANRPAVTNGGTWTCQQIVEQCDNACQAISCLDECTTHGTPDAQQQHNEVVSCGQHHFCTNEDCMRANCTTEMQACAPEAMGPAAQPPGEPAEPSNTP